MRSSVRVELIKNPLNWIFGIQLQQRAHDALIELRHLCPHRLSHLPCVETTGTRLPQDCMDNHIEALLESMVILWFYINLIQTIHIFEVLKR